MTASVRALIDRGQSCAHCGAQLRSGYVAPSATAPGRLHAVAGSEPITIFLCEDDPAARALMLERLRTTPGFAVVGSAGESRAALAGIAERQPDVVLLDHFVEGLGDDDGVARVRQAHPDGKVLIHSALPPSTRPKPHLAPDGYVHKDAPYEELCEVIGGLVAQP